MKYLLIIILGFITIGCSSTKTYKAPSISNTPPNGYQLNDLVFIDKSEVTNINYKLFMNYHERFFGKDSDIYKSLIIDSTVWRNVEDPLPLTTGKYSDASKLFESEYFRNISFDDHPVVGLTYDQAVLFTDWRTDRVLEMLLVEYGYLDSEDSNGSFTLEDYFNYKLDNVNVVDSLKFPYYYLIDNIESLKKLDPGYVYSYQHYQKYLADNEIQFTLPSFTVTMEPERLLGNVAEMTATKGLAFGGSWIHPLSQCHLDSTQIYDGPQNWLGFRNMSRIVTYDEYKKLKAKR